MYKLTVIILVFILGLIFVVKYPTKEAFEEATKPADKGVRCADLLIQEGSDFYLVNTKLAKVPGVNPLRFTSL